MNGILEHYFTNVQAQLDRKLAWINEMKFLT